MGNRSSGASVAGIRRTFIRLPGYFVSGTIRLPRAHPHALWLLAWVERMLQGQTLAEVQQTPPWPVPADPLLGRHLVCTLLDLGWLLPSWSRGSIAVSAELSARYQEEGRAGLAQLLSAVEEHPGEWWMEGLGGTLLSRQIAVQFDWDFKRKADLVISPSAAPQELLSHASLDVPDLVAKLGGAQLVWDARDGATLGGPLALGDRKDILFPLFGDAVRILPAELAQLEPVFTRRAPDLFQGGAGRRTEPEPAAEQKKAGLAMTPVRSTALPQPGPMHPLVAKVRAGLTQIPAGRFWMGDDRVANERPRHPVVITRSFWLGRTPVTQELWREVMDGLPYLRDIERHPDFPIIQISYSEMQRFFAKLNELPGGGGFCLPTEAQWEYACRAGSEAAYCFGDEPGSGERPGMLERYAWTKRSGQARLQRVAQLLPNAWGLHDIHGLVYETMRDGFRRYGREEVSDPVGPLDGERIVARGGFWGRFPLDRRGDREGEHFRCASRQIYEKSHRVSFRIACLVEDK